MRQQEAYQIQYKCSNTVNYSVSSTKILNNLTRPKSQKYLLFVELRQTSSQMFPRFAFRPVLKCALGRISRTSISGVRNSSDSAIDRVLQESYDGIMPRLAAIGVRMTFFDAGL